MQTSRRTHVNGASVVRGAKDELRGAVVARADVRDVGLAAHERLGGAQVAQLQGVGVDVDQQVLGLDVPAAGQRGGGHSTSAWAVLHSNQHIASTMLQAAAQRVRHQSPAPVAHAHAMDVRQRAQHLVRVQLD